MQGEPALKREQPAVQESKTLASEEYVVKTMPPVLGTLDMTAIFVAAIFYITNSATAVAAGAAAFTYWILCGVTFLFPAFSPPLSLASCSPMRALSTTGRIALWAISGASSPVSAPGCQACWPWSAALAQRSPTSNDSGTAG